MNSKEKFLLSIHNSIINLLEDDRLDERRRMELLAFCILTKIDGEAVDCGPFVLKPLNEQGDEGEDIAGNLHHQLMDMKKDLREVVRTDMQDHTQIVEEGEDVKTTLQKTYTQFVLGRQSK